MIDLEYSFEPRPWETWLRTKQMGDSVSAAQLLTILEEENDQAAEDALQEMEMACMTLDISDLPKLGGSGETAVRLRREEQLLRQGLQPDALEENDPLRLYLEEVAAMPAFGDEVLLAEEAAKGKQSAMEQLTNLGLSRVIALAGDYAGYGVLLLDLIQEGSMDCGMPFPTTTAELMNSTGTNGSGSIFPKPCSSRPVPVALDRNCGPPWRITGQWTSGFWEIWAGIPRWKRWLRNCI